MNISGFPTEPGDKFYSSGRDHSIDKIGILLENFPRNQFNIPF